MNIIGQSFSLKWRILFCNDVVSYDIIHVRKYIINIGMGALKIVISISVIGSALDSLQNLKMVNCKNFATKTQRRAKKSLQLS